MGGAQIRPLLHGGVVDGASQLLLRIAVEVHPDGLVQVADAEVDGLETLDLHYELDVGGAIVWAGESRRHIMHELGDLDGLREHIHARHAE